MAQPGKPEASISGTPSQGLFGATLGFFVGFAAVSLFGPTVAFLQKEVGMAAALAGLLISIPNLSGSLLRIPFAAMVEKDGGRKPFIVLLALSLVGVIGVYAVMSQGQEQIEASFGLLLFFGTLGGAGIATFSVGIGQTSYWFPQKKQGTALGVFAGVGNLAPGIFAVLLSSFTIPLVGLSGSYLIWAVFLGVGLVVYILTARNAWFFQYRRQGLDHDQARSRGASHGQELFPSGKAITSLKKSAGVGYTWIFVAVYFATFGGFLALTAWMPKLGTGLWGFDLSTAGLLTAGYSVGASILRVAGGPISDKVGGKLAALVSLGGAGLGSVFMAIGGTGPLALVGIGLMAIGMGVANAAVFKLVPQYVPQAVGGAAGWIGGLGAFGGFVIPLLLAAILDQGGGYNNGFWIFTGLFAASIVAIGVIKPPKKAKEQA